jgi:hypothetical protein
VVIATWERKIRNGHRRVGEMRPESWTDRDSRAVQPLAAALSDSHAGVRLGRNNSALQMSPPHLSPCLPPLSGRPEGTSCCSRGACRIVRHGKLDPARKRRFGRSASPSLTGVELDG